MVLCTILVCKTKISYMLDFYFKLPVSILLTSWFIDIKIETTNKSRGRFIKIERSLSIDLSKYSSPRRPFWKNINLIEKFVSFLQIIADFLSFGM